MDLSLATSFPFGGKRRFEVRPDAFNAVNHAQFSGVNGALNVASPTDHTVVNMPHDSNANVIDKDGAAAIGGVRAARGR